MCEKELFFFWGSLTLLRTFFSRFHNVPKFFCLLSRTAATSRNKSKYEATLACFVGGWPWSHFFSQDLLINYGLSQPPRCLAYGRLKAARVEEKEGYHFMWRSGPIGSEWVDLGGTVNEGRGSSLVPKRKESPTDQGRAFLGIFMMRMRRHLEFMCVSPWLAGIIFSVNRDVCRAGMSCFALSVCHVVWWKVLPLHKAIWVFVYSCCIPFVLLEQQMGSGGKT